IAALWIWIDVPHIRCARLQQRDDVGESSLRQCARRRPGKCLREGISGSESIRINVRQRGCAEDSKSGAHGRLAVMEWIPGKSDARVEIAERGIVLPQLVDRNRAARNG